MNLDFLEKFLANLTEPKKADPDKVHRSHVRSRKISINPKLIIAAVSVLVVLVVAFSVGTVISERKNIELQTFSGDENPSNSAQSPAFAEADDKTFSGNILLAFTRDDNKELHFLAVVNFKEAGRIRVSYIPVSTACTVNKIDGTMKEHLENGGITELLWAVGERYSLGIEKYVLYDENDFTKIMKKLGDTEITIENQINYDYNGLNFIIEKGPQVFTADTMLKYYLYLCDTMWDDQTKLTNITASIAKRIADFDKYSVEEAYNRIIDYVATDLSAMDIKNYESEIYGLVKLGSIDKIEIISDPSVFSK